VNAAAFPKNQSEPGGVSITLVYALITPLSCKVRRHSNQGVGPVSCACSSQRFLKSYLLQL